MVSLSLTIFFSGGRQELPFAGSGVIRPGDVIGPSRVPLIQVSLDSVDWMLTKRSDQTDVNPSVDAVGSVEAMGPQPSPSALLLDRVYGAQYKSVLGCGIAFPRISETFAWT